MIGFEILHSMCINMILSHTLVIMIDLEITHKISSFIVLEAGFYIKDIFDNFSHTGHNK